MNTSSYVVKTTRHLTDNHDHAEGRLHVLRRLGLITLFFSIVFWCACGDTFRPVVIPIPPTPPDPRSAHTALAITNNGDFNPGSVMLIDVSGDSTSGVGNVGRHPSYAALVPPSAGHIAVANMVDNSVTVVSTFAGSSALTAPTTITLSPHSNPVFLTSVESNVVYVANRGDLTITPFVPSSIAVISVISNTATQVIPLATPNPVSLAETPDGRKLYVASQGGVQNGVTVPSAVTSINTVDKSTNPLITDASINLPVSVVARADSARVYVLSQTNGDLATINTSTDTLISPTTPLSVGAGADFMTYDSHLNRLYVTNAALGTLTILDATVDPPNPLTPIPLPAGPNPSCPTGCSSIAALPDGSRTFVSTLLQSGSNVAAVVTVINSTDNHIVGNLSLPAVPALADCAGAAFRISTASAADSSRVYLAICDAGNVAVIRTSDNTLVSLPAPVSASNPLKANISGAAQSGSETTFSYSLSSGALQVGMSIVVTGMADAPDNGSFTITALGSGKTTCSQPDSGCTFTVLNPAGVSESGQSGVGTATPLQNPVFVLAGP